MSDTISSDSTSTASIDNLEEISDANQYLEDNFLESNLEGFIGLKENLEKVLDKMNKKNQKLVRSNFSNFVKCRETIHQIHVSDYVGSFEKSVDQIEYQVRKIEENYQKIQTEAEKDDLEEKKILEERKYEEILNLKEELEKCLKYRDYDGFVKKYLKSVNLNSKSGFFNEKIAECQSLLIRFQNNLLLELEKSLSEQNIHFLELYKKINQKESQKIDTTILILLKNYLNEQQFYNQIESCLIYAIKSFELTKNEFIHQQMIFSIINWMRSLFPGCSQIIQESSSNDQNIISETTSLESLNIAISERCSNDLNFNEIRLIENSFTKILIFNKQLKLRVSESNYTFYFKKYKEVVNEIKKNLIDQIPKVFNDRTIFLKLLRSIVGWIPTQVIKNKIYEVVDKFSKEDLDNLHVVEEISSKCGFRSREKLNIPEKSYEIKSENSNHSDTINENFESLKIDASDSRSSLSSKENTKLDLEYLEKYKIKVENIKNTLKKSQKILYNSINFSRVNKILSKNRQEILLKFLNLIKIESPVEMLMIILKLKKEFEINKNLLSNVKNDILQNKIVKFFICDILIEPEPILNNTEKELVGNIQQQFKWLKIKNE